MRFRHLWLFVCVTLLAFEFRIHPLYFYRIDAQVDSLLLSLLSHLLAPLNMFGATLFIDLKELSSKH